MDRPSKMPDPVPEAQELITVMADIAESEDEVPELQEGSSDEESVECRPKRKKPQKNNRQKWTDEEVTELNGLFSEEFQTNTLPGQKRIEKIMKKSEANSGIIWKRKRDTIKKKLSNMMIKRRNLKKK